MKSNQYLFAFIFFLTSLVTISSCGGKGGSSSDIVSNGPQQEESCLTDAQKTNIQTFLDRVSAIPEIVGGVVSTGRNDDGSYTTFNLAAAYDFIPVTDASWTVKYVFCSEISCSEIFQDSLEILDDGCLYADGILTQVLSSSTIRLNFTITETEGIENNIDLRLESGKFSDRETLKENGVLIFDYSFTQN